MPGESQGWGSHFTSSGPMPFFRGRLEGDIGNGPQLLSLKFWSGKPGLGRDRRPAEGTQAQQGLPKKLSALALIVLHVLVA